ncbi:MAG: Lyzozyme (1,4-beta-N-acetylmuramidase) [bacterium]|nr:Lyzozyme (1,4-beta-N-acetylmuramidase) [bacterium]
MIASRRLLVGLLATATLLALPACQGAPPALDVAEQAQVVCPGASTVEGIDVSEFQGNINWAAVKASGRQFAFIRVSDGTYQDPKFATNWAGAKAAGVLRGAYQFFRASDDPIAIADQFLARMGTLGNGDLPPVLDVEVTDGQSAATIRSRMEAWLAHVEQKTGRVPFIYVSPGFWPNVGSPNESHYRLWVANWQVNCPNTPTGWSSWQMWQYADNGTVSGISGAVDLDRFNGTLAQLQGIAGGAPYAAQYVAQSWPLASTPMNLVAGQSVAASITLKNTGSKTWDSNTKLGTTQPRDRASAFADGGWLSPSRAAHVTGTVPPGGTFKFSFNFHAPAKAGTYHEFFDLVQEGVAWFSDPGQGGPPDNQFEAQIVVTLPKLSGEFVAQSFPAANKTPMMLGVGQSVDAWIDLKNVGSDTWKAGVTKLAPTPRDAASTLATAAWLSPTRVSRLTADVPPGAVGRFTIPLTGVTAGDYTQTFGLLDEGVTWFADAANGGGPADDFMKLHVVVGDVPQSQPDAGAVADMSDAPGDPGTGGNGNGDTGGGTPPATPTTKSGCSLAADGSPASLVPLFAIFAALWLRRRFAHRST